MFASHLIGPVAQTAHHDRDREHAAERRAAHARASLREVNPDAGRSLASALVLWLTDHYLPPIDLGVRRRRQDRRNIASSKRRSRHGMGIRGLVPGTFART
jgi:hypothetical protein